MGSQFTEFVLNSPKRIPMPIGVYAGLEITGATIKDAVSSSQAQTEAVLALHQRFNTQVMLTAMDLSAEAEIFGCEVRMSDDEIPTVIGRRVSSESEIDSLTIPQVGEGRTSVHLQTAGNLVTHSHEVPVLGGVIGPFSLAGRIFGVSEALELSLTHPDVLEKLLDKTTEFLINYVQAFRDQGAMGVIMAEPAAGLLSPRGLSRFSATFVKQIVEQSQSHNFSIVYHNCGAKLVHLPRIIEAGADVYHFGAPMDIGKVLEQVDREYLIGGNLDPTSVFHSGSIDAVIKSTQSLLELSTGYKNFIPSSGCDIPPHTPVRNLDAFYSTVNNYPNS